MSIRNGEQRPLFSVCLSELKQGVQATQTDSTTAESAVNTRQDWESQVAAIFELSSSLKEQHDGLKKKQEEEEVSQEKHKQQLQKRMEEAKRQHQVTQRHLLVKGAMWGFVYNRLTVFSGSSRETGVTASETAAEQLQDHKEELLKQETGNDVREEQSRGGEEQVRHEDDVLITSAFW